MWPAPGACTWTRASQSVRLRAPAWRRDLRRCRFTRSLAPSIARASRGTAALAAEVKLHPGEHPVGLRRRRAGRRRQRDVRRGGRGARPLCVSNAVAAASRTCRTRWGGARASTRTTAAGPRREPDLADAAPGRGGPCRPRWRAPGRRGRLRLPAPDRRGPLGALTAAPAPDRAAVGRPARDALAMAEVTVTTCSARRPTRGRERWAPDWSCSRATGRRSTRPPGMVSVQLGDRRGRGAGAPARPRVRRGTPPGGGRRPESWPGGCVSHE